MSFHIQSNLGKVTCVKVRITNAGKNSELGGWAGINTMDITNRYIP